MTMRRPLQHQHSSVHHQMHHLVGVLLQLFDQFDFGSGPSTNACEQMAPCFEAALRLR